MQVSAFLKLIDGKAGDAVFFSPLFLCLTRQLDLIIFWYTGISTKFPLLIVGFNVRGKILERKNEVSVTSKVFSICT